MAARSLLAVAFAFAFALLLAAPVRAAASSSIVPTKNYIDTISGYIELSTCAEDVLSTVVRAQQSGCGDNMATTSYTCFCTDSSSYYSAMISSEVSNSCGTAGSAQASSAIAVFDGYCALGVEHGLSTTTSDTQTSSTASPAASASTAPATQTGSASTSAASASATSSAAGASSSSDSARTAAIAAGVAVPVGVIGLALVGYLFYRKRVSATRAHEQLPMASPETEKGYPPQELSPQSVQELPPHQPRQVHELDGNVRHEVAGDAGKSGAATINVGRPE
ncbi:uncharacterized protein BKCO1_1600035 [Diplodia corticola]|uniref:Uncharacterized protein n=1 Tax=Diplodia corticola TaxID=236234 RepID=A0A1J9S6S2_9PEZI|nr:uncharacterized protein BKCO1_1600035 [Diplodia corticola]OJD35636.1 hypothetical protein BKCO1_1600035 [Diplodia corticola]